MLLKSAFQHSEKEFTKNLLKIVELFQLKAWIGVCNVVLKKIRLAKNADSNLLSEEGFDPKFICACEES